MTDPREETGAQYVAEIESLDATVAAKIVHTATLVARTYLASLSKTALGTPVDQLELNALRTTWAEHTPSLVEELAVAYSTGYRVAFGSAPFATQVDDFTSTMKTRLDAIGDTLVKEASALVRTGGRELLIQTLREDVDAE